MLLQCRRTDRTTVHGWNHIIVTSPYAVCGCVCVRECFLSSSKQQDTYPIIRFFNGAVECVGTTCAIHASVCIVGLSECGAKLACAIMAPQLLLCPFIQSTLTAEAIKLLWYSSVLCRIHLNYYAGLALCSPKRLKNQFAIGNHARAQSTLSQWSAHECHTEEHGFG